MEFGNVFYSVQRSYSSVIVFLTYFLALLDQVVKLIDVFPYGTGFVLVFEYMLSDLSEVLRNSARPLTEVCSRVLCIILIFLNREMQ